MKIIFICGSLEPGKDGVGDYTRRLCKELVKKGISVGILSYNDKYSQNRIEECEEYGDCKISYLRLPYTWKNKKRNNEAKKWIEFYGPEWLSLQFVPYSFNNKGLPFGLGSQLKKNGGDRKWHIMFHELWLGMEVGATFKHTLVGEIQKYIIKKIIKTLKPIAINTQTLLYKKQIKKIGVNSKLLPLFSNIPYFEPNFIKDEKARNLLDIELILFGSIHPNAPVEEFANEVANYYQDIRNINLKLTLVGRSGNEKQNWIKIFKEKGFIIKDLGEQNEENITKALQKATIGITTTPIYLVEKSGTVITMRQNNLPIISVSKKWRSKNNIIIKNPEDVLEYQIGNFKKFTNLKLNQSKKNDIDIVTNLFLESLHYY